MVGSDLDDNAKASYMMSEIREKVLRMKDEGKDVSNMDDILIFKDSDLITEMPVSESIDYILKNWNIENSYNITSHRKVIGPVLVYGRKLVNGEINRNVGPIISRQNDLNHVIAGALQGHNDTINDLSLRLSKLETDYERIERTVPKVERVLNTQNHIVQYIGDINQRLDQIMATLNLSTECVNAKAFADAFGGTEENIKDLYSMFIGYYIGCSNVIDIGCGRGYFLDLAAANSFTAYGIDVSADTVDECKNKGREALHVDAIAHLIQLNDASLDGAFIAHVVEHVSHEYLIKLLKLLGQKLQPGAPLVIVTPNILNISVSTVSFYMDPTHRTHIHPDYLEFVLKSNSFKIVEKKWYQPTIPASIKLEKIDVEELPDNEKLMAKRLNSNIDKLNELLFGNRDFAIVAKRLA